MRPFLLWRSDWPVVGQHLCSILCCVACSGAPGASLSTMRAFSIMRLSAFCCARWVEGICSCIACCWSTLRVCRQKLLPLPLPPQRGGPTHTCKALVREGEMRAGAFFLFRYHNDPASLAKEHSYFRF